MLTAVVSNFVWESVERSLKYLYLKDKKFQTKTSSRKELNAQEEAFKEQRADIKYPSNHILVLPLCPIMHLPNHLLHHFIHDFAYVLVHSLAV